jgi:hypothetical protein
MDFNDYLLIAVLLINLGLVIRFIRKSMKDADLAYKEMMKERNS